MRRRSRTGEIVDLIDFQLKRIDHVVPEEFQTADWTANGPMFSFRPVNKLSRQMTSMTVADQSITEGGCPEIRRHRYEGCA